MQAIADSLSDLGLMIMIYGRSGSGKTAACRSLKPEETYWISYELDQTAACLHGWGWDRWNCETPLGFQSTLHEISQIGKKKEIRHVVVDTLSGYVEQLMSEFISQNGGSLNQKEKFDMWNTVGDRVVETIEKLKGLCSRGKDVILLCHLRYREEKNELSADGKPQIHREPMLFGQLPEKICKRIPVVLIAKSFKLGPHTKFTLNTVGGEGDYGTDKFRILPNSQENDVLKILNQLRGGVGIQAKISHLPEHKEHRAETPSLPEDPKPTTESATKDSSPLPPTKLPKDVLTKNIYKLGAQLNKAEPLVRYEIKAKYGKTISKLSREELREYGASLQEQIDALKVQEREVFDAS
jgi:hypothetical protein